MPAPFDRRDDDVFAVLGAAASAVRDVLLEVADREAGGDRPGQYRLDLTADRAATEVLARAGFAVLSEESGTSEGSGPMVVLDPVDGSTNSSRGLPMWATSMAVVDGGVVTHALVVDHTAGTAWHAVRGGGAWCGGRRLAVRGQVAMREAIVGLNGPPAGHLGWQQFRAYGCASIELCMIADGRLDGYLGLVADAHGVWDYLGGMLIVNEAGGVVADALGRPLVTGRHADRRTLIAATGAGLLAELRSAAEPGGG